MNAPNYRELIDGLPQPMWVFSESGFRILEVNNAAILKYGYSQEEFLNLRLTDLLLQSETETFLNHLATERDDSGTNPSGTWRHQLKNGQIINVELTSHRITWEGIAAKVVICWDVTTYLRMENSLRQAEQQYRGIFENTREGIYQSTVQGRFLRVNPSLARMMGYDSPEEVIAELADIGAQFYVNPSERDRIIELVIQKGQAIEIESQVFRKDKKIIWVRDHIRAIKDEEGKVLYLEGSMEDITERKDTLAKLNMHKQFSNMIIHAQSRFLGGEDYRFAFDVLLEDLLSLTKSDYGFIGEVLYKPNGDPYLKTHTITNIAWDEHTRAFYNDNIQTGLIFDNLNTLFGQVMVTGRPVIANSPYTDPRRGGLPKGHPPLNAFLGLPFGLNGKTEGMLGLSNRPGGYDEELISFLEPFVKNISNLLRVTQSERLRRQAEVELKEQFEELQKTNKELDHFVYSTSHDLRAPLASILGLVNVAEVEPNKEVIPNYLRMIRESANRLDAFIGSILDYSRNARMATRAEKINFEHLLIEVQKRFSLFPNADRPNVTIQVSGGECYCDRTRLEIILNNVFSNAIRYQDIHKARSYINIKVEISSEQLTIIIQDNGIGIEKQYLDEIFTMFFRATDYAKGSGLGLYIAREAAIKMGGSIDVQSTYGEGSEFRITLPNCYPA